MCCLCSADLGRFVSACEIFCLVSGDSVRLQLYVFSIFLNAFSISKHPINDVYQGCPGVATFASKTKSHDDKGRSRRKHPTKYV